VFGGTSLLEKSSLDFPKCTIDDRTYKEDGRKRCGSARIREGGGVSVGIYHPAKN